MMQEENKRMQDQVETVLMISQLERGTTPMELSPIDVHEVVEEAISHVALIVQNRAGMIYKHLDASFSNISGNKNHLTNVITNLLDNAIKYSEGSPIIEVRTWSEEKDIAIEVKDQGMGMDAETLQLILKNSTASKAGMFTILRGMVWACLT